MAEILGADKVSNQADKFAPIIIPQAILSNALMPRAGVNSTGGSLASARCQHPISDSPFVCIVFADEKPNNFSLVFHA
jgi:hypothetical protein